MVWESTKRLIEIAIGMIQGERISQMVHGLNKVGERYLGAISYWTEEGFKKYASSGLFDWHAAVVCGKVTIEELTAKPKSVLYEDEHQIIVATSTDQ